MCAAPSYTRTVVYVRRDRTREFQKASFNQCLMDYFGIEDDFGRMECFMEDNIVFLQPPLQQQQQQQHRKSLKESEDTRLDNKDRPTACRFQHPSFCVAHKITEKEKETLPPEIVGRGVDVGVCILLESKDGRVLVTRRAPHMRTFPGVWVPPGGHVEEGETFSEVGAREMKEETGLVLEPHEYQRCQMLGLWESMYPPVLYMGLPKRHHLVIYLHLKLDHSTESLQQRLELDHNEVDACVWLTREMANIVVYGSNNKPNEEIPITMVNSTGEHREGRMNPKALRKKMPEPDHEVERLTTGTRYALKLWLQDHPQEREEEKPPSQMMVSSRVESSKHRPDSQHLLNTRRSGLANRLYNPLTVVSNVNVDY